METMTAMKIVGALLVVAESLLIGYLVWVGRNGGVR